MHATGLARDVAERVVRKNMLELPYWSDKQDVCLVGEVATEEEFTTILSQLQSNS